MIPYPPNAARVDQIIEDDPMFDMRQLGAVLGVNERTAARLCASGKLPAKNYGVEGSRKCIWRVLLSDALAFRKAPDNTLLVVPKIQRRDILPPYIKRIVG